MQKLKIHLENCYGIRKIIQEFDFSKSRAVAIYAPNGVMKSSLAKTFSDLSKGTSSSDQIFPGRANVRAISDEKGVELNKDNVFVIQPYDEVFGHTEKTSTLLVNSKLRKEYEQLYKDIDALKAVFLKSIGDLSGSKKDIEKEISLA